MVIFYSNYLFNEAGQIFCFDEFKNVFFLTIFYFLINRLIIHHLLKNQTKFTTTATFVNIPIEKWKHFTWIYSNENHQSDLYIDSARQQSIDFGVMNLDFESK